MEGIKSAISNGLSSLHLNGNGVKKPSSTFHPLDPLSASEIALTSATIRAYLAQDKSDTPKAYKSVYISLIEPPKAEVIAFLGISTSPTDLHPVSSGVLPARKAESSVIDGLSGRAFTFVVELKDGKAEVLSKEDLPVGVQPGISLEELSAAEVAIKADPTVIKLCADVGITSDQIQCDCWSIGYDDRFGPERRLQQAFLYARLGPDEHLYAHPLDFVPVIDTNSLEILHIDWAPHRLDPKDSFKLSGGSSIPHDLKDDSFVISGRERIPPPMERFDFLPELLKEEAIKKGTEWKYREGLKPLHVVQPEGVSFQMDGNRLTWQNWDLHIGFNYREGLILNTIQYTDKDEGRARPLVYRASITEMVVPYSSPEYPHPRKFAFDVGEYGLGAMSNSLSLGCDCLGQIHYIDAEMSGHDGQAIKIPNAVCIHEEDDGTLFKHTDYRAGGKVRSVRARKLIIQQVCTVANYEYIFAWSLHQDGTISLEIGLTGILNLYVMAEGEKAGTFGTEVAPRVMAHHHQHIFSLRLDPMIDGLLNSVVETDILPMSQPTGSEENWAGNGFYTQKTILNSTADGPRNADLAKGRMWTIVNEDKTHYSSGAPVGYKVMCAAMPPLLPKPDSLVGRRATFAKNNLWVTPFADSEIYPAGKHVTQTKKAPEDSIEGWMKGDKKISKTDIVTWFSIGVTHIPRPEDFPVMPTEHISFLLKPVGFFRQNPALDVPATKDANSKLAVVNGAAASCCKA